MTHLVDAFCVLAAVVHFRLGALVQVGHPRDGVQRAVDEQTPVADVVVASLESDIVALNLGTRSGDHRFLELRLFIRPFSLDEGFK